MQTQDENMGNKPSVSTTAAQKPSGAPKPADALEPADAPANLKADANEDAKNAVPVDDAKNAVPVDEDTKEGAKDASVATAAFAATAMEDTEAINKRKKKKKNQEERKMVFDDIPTELLKECADALSKYKAGDASAILDGERAGPELLDDAPAHAPALAPALMPALMPMLVRAHSHPRPPSCPCPCCRDTVMRIQKSLESGLEIIMEKDADAVKKQKIVDEAAHEATRVCTNTRNIGIAIKDTGIQFYQAHSECTLVVQSELAKRVAVASNTNTKDAEIASTTDRCSTQTERYGICVRS